MISDNQSTGGTTVSAALVILVGILVTPIGIAGFAALGFKMMGVLLLILAITGVLLIAGGIKMIVDANRLEKDIKRLLDQNAADKPKQHAAYIYNENFITYMVEEKTWREFAVVEKKFRREDSIYLFIAGMILGTFVLVRLRHADWKTAFVITAFIMTIAVLLRHYLNMRILVSKKKDRTITIADQYIKVNEHIYTLFAENRFTSQVRLLENVQPAILEYKIHWNTRKGITFDELRIPVPADMLPAIREYVNKSMRKTER